MSSASAVARLCGYYFLYFSTVGVLLPFLPAYLKGLGQSATRVGVLLALAPLLATFAPPLWARLADRSGHPERVLRTLSMGAFVGFSGLVVARSFWELAAALLVYGAFSSSVSSVVDSLTLTQLEGSGTRYARVRLFGSLGFVVSSTAFGLWVANIDRRVVLVPLALMGLYALWSFRLGPPLRPLPEVPRGRPAPLARRREVWLFLVATCLHWVACAPFHGNYAIYVTDLGHPPWVVGLSAALGVTAEIGVMYAYPHFAHRIAPRYVLAVACAMSALRWMGVALTTHPSALLALSLLHGFTFGAFYVSSVSYLARRIPLSQRTAGQALFVSVTFGVGGLAGFALAGAGYDALGGPVLFGLASGVECVAAGLACSLPKPQGIDFDGQPSEPQTR